MGHFNTYQLNSNYTTSDGVNLINPTFEIVELYLYCESNSYDLILNWIDETNNINRLFVNSSFLSPEFPTAEFVENQLLQIPEFSNSTIINT